MIHHIYIIHFYYSIGKNIEIVWFNIMYFVFVHSFCTLMKLDANAIHSWPDIGRGSLVLGCTLISCLLTFSTLHLLVYRHDVTLWAGRSNSSAVIRYGHLWQDRSVSGVKVENGNNECSMHARIHKVWNQWDENVIKYQTERWPLVYFLTFLRRLTYIHK